MPSCLWLPRTQVRPPGFLACGPLGVPRLVAAPVPAGNCRHACLWAGSRRGPNPIEVLYPWARPCLVGSPSVRCRAFAPGSWRPAQCLPVDATVSPAPLP
eukprot:4592128-Heterocapsa_arctica.AAC.1